jgi:hypothetical protein
MIAGMNWIAAGVFVFFFLVVAVMGFLSVRWQRGDLSKLDENLTAEQHRKINTPMLYVLSLE